MGDIIKWFLGLFGGGGYAPPPDPNDPCNAATCVNAKNRVATARSKFNTICQALQFLNSVAAACRIVLSSPIWVLAVVLAAITLIAAVLGIQQLAAIAAAALGVVLIIWAMSWLLLFIVGQIVEQLAPELVKQEEALIAAVADVKANCPARCQGDISVPQCNFA